MYTLLFVVLDQDAIYGQVNGFKLIFSFNLILQLIHMSSSNTKQFVLNALLTKRYGMIIIYTKYTAIRYENSMPIGLEICRHNNFYARLHSDNCIFAQLKQFIYFTPSYGCWMLIPSSIVQELAYVKRCSIAAVESSSQIRPAYPNLTKYG